MISIRLAERDDLPAVVAISNWAALHSLANFATEPEPEETWVATWEATRTHHPWLVAVDGARVVGFAKSGPHRARGAYAWSADVSVYVDPVAHRTGVGTALYGRFIPTLRAQGYVTLIAGITTPNPGSERLHAQAGFVRCGTFRQIGWKFGGWHDVGYWENHLVSASDDAAPRPIRPVADVWRS